MDGTGLACHPLSTPITRGEGDAAYENDSLLNLLHSIQTPFHFACTCTLDNYAPLE